jgi:hypothetical protein
VQVHGHDAVHAHGLEQARHVGGRDGHARRHLAVLAGVAVVGDDARDALGAGAAHGGHHEQQLHEVLIDRRAGGLDEVHILAAHIVMHLAMHIVANIVVRIVTDIVMHIVAHIVAHIVTDIVTHTVMHTTIYEIISNIVQQ